MMTATEYRNSLKGLGLKIVHAGPVLGISGRQSQGLASGHSNVSGTIERLLLAMERDPTLLKFLLDLDRKALTGERNCEVQP